MKVTLLAVGHGEGQRYFLPENVLRVDIALLTQQVEVPQERLTQCLDARHPSHQQHVLAQWRLEIEIPVLVGCYHGLLESVGKFSARRGYGNRPGELSSGDAVQELPAQGSQQGVGDDGIDHAAAAFRLSAARRDELRHTVIVSEVGGMSAPDPL